MDITAYINSGILELYILNQLTEQERLEVESMCIKYPEVLVERIAIEEALESLAVSEQKKPPAFLKEVILNEINNHSPVINTHLKATRSPLYWSIAASVIGLIASVSAYYFYDESTKLKQELAQIQHHAEMQNHELVILKNPDFKQINLAKIDSTKEMKPASIYWNKQSKEVFISWNNTEALPEDKQYQLWAIVDDKPVDAGVFDITDSLQQMKLIGNATAFAVTVERKGGSPTPTLSSMVVMGAI